MEGQSHQQNHSTPGRSLMVTGLTAGPVYGINQTESESEDSPLISHPKQRVEEGDWSQNKLAVIGHYLPFISNFMPQSKLKKSEKMCRLISFIIIAILMVITMGIAILLLVYPSGHAQMSTTYEGLTSQVASVDPFYYDMEVSRADYESYEAMVYVLPCSSLILHSNTYSGTYQGRLAHGNEHQQLSQLESLAYLVDGSHVTISINVTSSPSHGSMYLYVLSDYKAYQSFDETRDNYLERYTINPSLHDVTNVSFPVKEAGFYFYIIALPNGANYNFFYDIKQVYFNQSDFYKVKSDVCNLQPMPSSCLFSLNQSTIPNGDLQCIMLHTISPADRVRFYNLNVKFIRKTLNYINCIVLTFFVLLFIALFGLCIYDAYRIHLDSKVTTFDTCCLFRKKRRRTISINH
jgi:hypothetical protein